jgi:hypothetical protein
MTSNSLIKTSIKREDDFSSLDNLFGYSANDIEKQNKTTVVGENNVLLVLNEFEEFIQLNFDKRKAYDIKTSLCPQEINKFLQLISINQHQYSYSFLYSDKVGVFASKLMVQSYLSGNSEFNFDFSNMPWINHFARDIFADKNNPVRININGHIGNYCFAMSENLIVTLNGNARDSLLGNSKNNEIYIQGNVGRYFSLMGENLDVTIKGDVKNEFGFGLTNSYVAIDGVVEGFSNVGPHYIFPSDIDVVPGNFYERYSGKDAINHPKYIELMQKYGEKMNDLEARFK